MKNTVHKRSCLTLLDQQFYQALIWKITWLVQRFSVDHRWFIMYWKESV